MAPSPLNVVAATPGTLSISLSIPQLVRVGRTGTVVVTYTNPTSNDLMAPLLAISSTNAGISFSTPDNPNDYVTTAEVLAVAPSGPAGILRPGQSGQLSLTLLAQGTGRQHARGGRPDRSGSDHRLVITGVGAPAVPFRPQPGVPSGPT